VIDAIDGEKKKNWNVTVTINEQPVQFKIDTGAQCNDISSQTYFQLSKTPPNKSKASLVVFGGNRLNLIGKSTLLCSYKGKESTGQLISKLSTSPTYSVYIHAQRCKW